MPIKEIIMSIVVILMMVAVALFVISTLEINYEPLGVSGGFDGVFDVLNNSRDQNLTTHFGLDEPRVYKFNGYEWSLVESTYVGYAGDIVRVHRDGLD